jgi:cellulose synthase/poly-beta-1,6-N-acetylglucosamine synthase-like glycosyltransferase
MNSSIVMGIILFSNVFFLFYLLIYATSLLLSNLAGNVRMYSYRRQERLQNVLNHQFYFPISIIVPAFNESLTILTTVDNLLKLDYRQYEIIVVDDGSTDDTKQKMIERYGLKPEKGRPIRYAVPCHPIREVYTGKAGAVPIILVSKENGKCKADASNAGINVMNYPYFADMDADEILQKDALIYASRAILSDDNVIGVGGNIKISNGVRFRDAMPVSVKLGTNLVSDMQVMEYGRSFVGTRIFNNFFNANLIISGGFGVFKKSAVERVGGYSTDSMGEDMELTMKLHAFYRKNRIRYQMKYVPDSVCWTQAPFTMKSLKKQRERWHCGLMQCIWKYRSMILNPRYGVIGMFSLPYSIFYELFCPFFILLGWFVIIASSVLQIINVPYVIYVFLLYVSFGVLLTMVAFGNKVFMKNEYVSEPDFWRAAGLSLMDALFFRPYLFVIEFFAFFKYRKLRKGWVSPERTAFKTD